MNNLVLDYTNKIIEYFDKIRISDDITTPFEITIPQIFSFKNDIYGIVINVDISNEIAIKYDIKYDLINILDIDLEINFNPFSIFFKFVYPNPNFNYNKYLADVKINKSILDKLSLKNWDMIDVDRSIDVDKLQKYLNSIPNPQSKLVVEYIINKTMYVTFKQMKSELLKQIKKLPDKINIYFPLGDKIGSEHWIIVLLWPYLRNKTIKVITKPDDLDNLYPILMLDDAIYSGARMHGMIEEFMYSLQGDQEITFIILVTYALSSGLNSIKENLKNYKLKLDFYVDNIITSESNIILNGQTLNHIDVYLISEIDIRSAALYFDHKISITTHSQIYPEIVKRLPSRYKIEELEKELLAL